MSKTMSNETKVRIKIVTRTGGTYYYCSMAPDARPLAVNSRNLDLAATFGEYYEAKRIASELLYSPFRAHVYNTSKWIDIDGVIVEQAK